MNVNSNNNVINIRPKTDIYNFFQRLPYKFEQVIYEFIDNSIDSFYKHQEELKKSEKNFKLKINLIWEPSNDRIIIEDNAFGMDYNDFQRAFILNVPPKDSSYKSEFGLGLKTAACWLGKKYTIVSTQLGKSDEFSATLDSEFLKITKREELKVSKFEVGVEEHYSRITVEGLNRPINDSAWSGLSKKIVDTYFSDMEKYPIEIRKVKKNLDEKKNEVFETDKKYYSLEEVEPLKKTNEIKVLLEEDKNWESDFEGQLVVSENEEIRFNGQLLLFERMKQRDAGLYIYRRGRLIKLYKPERIFGQEGTHASKRLKIIVFIDQVPVTFDKSNISISHEEEENFHELLFEITKGKNKKKLDFKKKGDSYRKKAEKQIPSRQKNSIEDMEEKPKLKGESEEKKEESLEFEETELSKRRTEYEKKLVSPSIICRENNDINNWIEIYKLETEEVSIEINKKCFIEKYEFLNDEKVWNFFKELVKVLLGSFFLLRVGDTVLSLDSTLVKNLVNYLNEEFYKK